MKYALVAAILVLTACKPLVERKPQTQVAATACVERSLIFQFITAERQKNDELRKYLMTNGCFALPPYMELDILDNQGTVAEVEVSRFGMMRLAPGMDKVKSVKAWIQTADLKNLREHVKVNTQQAGLEK